MKIAFITNICPNYRYPLFLKLSKKYNLDFFFYSDGNIWYWEKKNPIYNSSLVKSERRRENQHALGIKGLIRFLLNAQYDVYIKCINGKLALLLTFFYAKIVRKPFILWTGIWMHPKSFLHFFSYPFTKYIYSKSDAIVVYGLHVKRYLLEMGVDESKIFLAWNTADNTLFSKQISNIEKSQIRKNLNIKSEKTILFVGRLDPVKGLQYLFKAFSIISNKIDCSLIIVGEGSEKEKLLKLKDKLDLNNIQFFNYVAPDKLYSYYAMADVLVLPSVTTKKVKETWGLVINEAMNQGCPIVTTDAVGAAVGGLVDHRENGVIVAEKDVLALAKAILEILTDQQFAERLGKNAFAKIQCWDYEHQARGFYYAIDFVTR